MTDTATGDGRTARRSRNLDKVLDAVTELWAESFVVPSVDRIAERSGVSLRSLYRYFDDQDSLLHAAIERTNEQTATLMRIHEFGAGPLDVRIERLVEARVRLYEHIAPTFRATLHNAPRSEPIAAGLATTRRALRTQTEQQFASELEALDPHERSEVRTAVDLLTQLDAIDQCRSVRRLSVARTKRTIQHALLALLG